MKIMLAENIRRFRKEKTMTQEQLAEALGVTVGAISKWELGASVPDISYIMEMAVFFETSVDVLLGYVLQSSSLEAALERIAQCRKNKDFEESKSEVEKALQKFPNNFMIIYRCGELLALNSIERKDRRTSDRAITLLHHAIDLFSQNKDDSISEIDIYKAIANCYLASGRAEESLKLLKQHNPCGINNSAIAIIYSAVLHNAAEAFPYLTRSFGDCLQALINTMVGFANAYSEQKQTGNALDALTWLSDLLLGLKKQETGVAYVDKVVSIMSVNCAALAETLGKHEEAETYLRRAYRLGTMFDKEPDYGINGIKFCENASSTATAYDDLGETAMSGIERTMQGVNTEVPALMEVWEKVKHEEV